MKPPPIPVTLLIIVILGSCSSSPVAYFTNALKESAHVSLVSPETLDSPEVFTVDPGKREEIYIPWDGPYDITVTTNKTEFTQTFEEAQLGEICGTSHRNCSFKIQNGTLELTSGPPKLFDILVAIPGIACVLAVIALPIYLVVRSTNKTHNPSPPN